jgi:hypothetical protein
MSGIISPRIIGAVERECRGVQKDVQRLENMKISLMKNHDREMLDVLTIIASRLYVSFAMTEYTMDKLNAMGEIIKKLPNTDDFRDLRKDMENLRDTGLVKLEEVLNIVKNMQPNQDQTAYDNSGSVNQNHPDRNNLSGTPSDGTLPRFW